MKAAIYVRVSTTLQVDKDSLPMQRDDLVNYCKFALNIDDYEIFEDAGYSGKDTDRPAYQEMMERIRQGEFSHLLVWKIDRISRNVLDFAGMYQELKKHEVSFVSRGEQFDTSSAMGEAMLKIILVFAELERELAAERVTATMLSRASKGLFNGGKIPYGYKVSDGDEYLLVNDSEAPTIKLIYDLYDKHKSQRKVESILNGMDVRNRSGKHFGHTAIGWMLKNPVYKGTLRYNRQNGSKIKPEKEWLLIDDNHEPIISKDQWERVNDIRNENAQKDSSMFRVGIHTHLFSGLLRCDHCGKRMTATTTKVQKDGYRPSKYRCDTPDCVASPKSTLDNKVAPVVFQNISDIAKGKKVVSTKQNELVEYTINGEKMEVSHAYLDKEKEKYQRALARLNDLYVFSGMSEKDYLIKKKDIEDKLKSIKKPAPKRKKVDDDFLKLASYYLVNKEFMGRGKIDFRKIVDTVDKNILKAFLQDIIFDIRIHDGQVSSIVYANGDVIVITD